MQAQKGFRSIGRLCDERPCSDLARTSHEQTVTTDTNLTQGCSGIVPCCTHFVGFRDDAYVRAIRVFVRPDFIHRRWDHRARREIADGDTIVFATGDEHQAPSPFNGADVQEDEG